MRTRAIWIGVILVLCFCGLAVSQALSLERLVDLSRLAAPPALAQETRPPASPVLKSRFAWPVPVGWSAPRLVGEPGHPDQALLTLLGLPSAHAADVALPPVAGLSLVEAAGVGPWPRPIPVAASVMHDRPALGRAVASGGCAEVPGGRQPLGSTIADKMPDKCDDRLLGNWICGQVLQHSGRLKFGYQVIFSRTIGAGGYEHIRRRVIEERSGTDKMKNWKVDRKWHPIPGGGGRLAAASCNGRQKSGNRILSISEKEPDGFDRTRVDYYVDSEGVGWRRLYRVWWKGDVPSSKLLDNRRCNRET